MTRHVRRGGKVWINIFPDKPVTQKPAETRMGSGKGNPEKWGRCGQTRPHHVRAVVPDAAVARKAIDLAIQKLPIKARYIAREEGF
jgi:large subunit ribosomal protein L16